MTDPQDEGSFSATRFTTGFFSYKQHFYKQRLAEIGKKSSKWLSNTLRLNFWHRKTIGILHPRYHLTITGHILRISKKEQAKEQACLYSWDYATNYNENEDENENIFT